MTNHARWRQYILGAKEWPSVWSQALARLERWQEAERHLDASVQIPHSGECGLLYRDQGDRASAQAHFDQTCAQFEASGLRRERETVQRYLIHMVQNWYGVTAHHVAQY
jgi:hypothetical protein